MSAPTAMSAMAGTRYLAARIVAGHPEQGWSMLCNGVIVFDDGGEMLPDGRAVAPDRPAPAVPLAMAA